MKRRKKPSLTADHFSCNSWCCCWSCHSFRVVLFLILMMILKLLLLSSFVSRILTLVSLDVQSPCCSHTHFPWVCFHQRHSWTNLLPSLFRLCLELLFLFSSLFLGCCSKEAQEKESKESHANDWCNDDSYPTALNTGFLTWLSCQSFQLVLQSLDRLRQT